MEDIFLKLFNMSITAGWLILAVSVIRFIFKKAPKWIFCVMWGLVGIRLLLPFSFESILSLIPSSQTVPTDIMYTSAPEIHSGIPALNSVINPVITETFTPTDLSASTANPIQTLITVFSYIWITVTGIMLIYALLSYIALKLKVRTATKLYGNIRQCENVDSPFVLGIIKPLIYLPYSIEEEDCSLVIEHENAHIKRRDHLIKPFAFLLLSIYWFNPLIWAAYILLCRDIEIACDEKVLKKNRQRKKESIFNGTSQLCNKPQIYCGLSYSIRGSRSKNKDKKYNELQKTCFLDNSYFNYSVYYLFRLFSQRSADKRS